MTCLNQYPPLTGYDVADDPALLDGLFRKGGGWAAEEVHELGQPAELVGGTGVGGRLANEHPTGAAHPRPVRPPHRRVEFHTAYHDLMLRSAGAIDRGETAFKSLGLAFGKYWVTKRGPAHAAEALECPGGNGYVEESGMPRLFRESPLNSAWEGSGNVAALDVLRAMMRRPEAVAAFFTEVESASGRPPGGRRRLLRLPAGP